MAKINPWALRPVECTTETKTFFDPLYPEMPLTFTLMTGFDLGRELGIQQIAVDLHNRFVKGIKDDETGEIVTEAIEPVGGEHGAITPTVNALAIQKYARLLGQQEIGPDAYGFKEIAALSLTMPDALWAVIQWSESLAVNTGAVKESLKKTLPATTNSASEKH